MSKPQTAASPPPTDKATGFLAFANVTYQTLWPLVAQTKEAVVLLHAFANVRYWRKADVGFPSDHRKADVFGKAST